MAELPQNHLPLCAAELLQSAFRYALALTHHPEDAEDLVHEAWMNLRDSYGGVESRAVLIVSVRNLFIDQCRRRRIVHFESLDDLETCDTPTEDALEPGLQGDLDTLLAVLRPAARETIFLYYHHGYTAEEISQITGQPRNTVLSILRRAIQKVQAAAACDRVPQLSISQDRLFPDGMVKKQPARPG